MSERREYKLEEVVELFQGLAINKQTRYLLKEKGLPLLRITDMFSNTYSQFIDPVNVPQQCIARESEIIFTRTGQVGFVFKGKVGVIHNNCFKVKPKENLYGDFLFWFLKQPAIKELSNSIASGSVQLDLPHSAFKSIPIQVPSLPEQKAIASVLSSLDEKIDLLHRQNKTLEAMAETLFRQWFVEEDSDFREGCLADVAINVKEAIKASDLKSESKYIGLEHIDQRNIALKHYGFGSEVSSNKYAFQRHDILFGKLRPYFHKVCFAPFLGICSTDILVIRPIKSELFAFCLFAFFQDEVVEYANLTSGGTRMPRTDWTTLKNYPIAIPDSYSIERFNNAVSSSLKKISSNLEQIRTLETLRDTLLPKLMSGEVRVNYP